MPNSHLFLYPENSYFMRKEIMIIDGCKSTRHQLHNFLKERFHVISMSDGMSAMYHMRKNPAPDLIIIDPEQENHPDWEIIRYLRSNRFFSSIPVIVVSAQDYEVNRFQSIRNGILDYFEKPFSLPELMASVEGVIYGRLTEKIF
jgi:DNA-binding response OmpR family regulator